MYSCLAPYWADNEDMSTQRRSSGTPGLAPAVVSTGVGAVLVVIYHVLAALEVGKIGAPTDIGGGLILLAGYVLIVAGVALAAAWLWVKARDRGSAR